MKKRRRGCGCGCGCKKQAGFNPGQKSSEKKSASSAAQPEKQKG